MKNKSILFFFLAFSLSTFAMTEYEIMNAKNLYAMYLKESAYNETLFKEQFNAYANFLKQTKEKDCYIADVLEQHFKQVIEKDRIEFERVQNDLNKWQESVKNAYFLKDMNKGLFLSGLAGSGLSAVIGYLAFCVLKNPELGDPEGILEAFLVVSGLASSLISAVLVIAGWNYAKPMQDELTRIREHIKILNSNYIYMSNNLNKLSC